MTDDSQHLRETLDELHQQLESAEAVDEDVAEKLRIALADIRAKLDAEVDFEAEGEPDDETTENDEPQTLAEHVNEAAVQFEESHPTLAGTLQRLVDMLAQLGI